MAFEYDGTKQKRTTGIEWASHTWNPFAGCTIKSAGCKNCYAMALAARLEAMGQATYKGTTKIAAGRPVWTGKINRASATTWNKPATIKEPSIFFVNSMSDFFHANVPSAWQIEAMEFMASLPRHQFQVLTKRPESVAEWIENHWPAGSFPDNVWVGATVEDGRVLERIDAVRRYPARIRFLSVEPLIGSVKDADFTDISWVITGGESGPGARPMDADWIREVRDSLVDLEIPHFFKQYGISKNNPLWAEAIARGEAPGPYVSRLDPVGKGGSMIDGRYWKEMPAGYEVPEYDAALADVKADGAKPKTKTKPPATPEKNGQGRLF